MINKFLLKTVAGTPGHTAKVIIQHLEKKAKLLKGSSNSDIYASLLEDRMVVAFSINNAESYYEKLYDLDRVMGFIEEDISTFVFLILFCETKKFRDEVRPNKFGNSSFSIVTKVIHEVCEKRSKLCKKSLSEFREQADKICELHIFNF